MTDRIRDMLFERRHGIHRSTARKPRRIARFCDGRLLTGHASMHRTPEARKWRTQLRLMRARAELGRGKEPGNA